MEEEATIEKPNSTETPNDDFEEDQDECCLCVCTFLDEVELNYHLKHDHKQII